MDTCIQALSKMKLHVIHNYKSHAIADLEAASTCYCLPHMDSTTCHIRSQDLPLPSTMFEGRKEWFFLFVFLITFYQWSAFSWSQRWSGPMPSSPPTNSFKVVGCSESYSLLSLTNLVLNKDFIFVASGFCFLLQ